MDIFLKNSKRLFLYLDPLLMPTSQRKLAMFKFHILQNLYIFTTSHMP